jgi:Helix-turn-helix domain
MAAPNTQTRARQCAALLALLSATPASTVTIRDQLGILSPAARVLDLRKAGHSIKTLTTTAHDADGRPHRAALYVLEAVQ